MTQILPKDVPATLTGAKAKVLRDKVIKQTMQFVEDLKHDLEIEADVILHVGEEHSDYSDTIKYHVKEIRFAMRNLKMVGRRIKKAEYAHINKTQGSKRKP